MHVDIVVKLDKELIPIELKYKTTNYNKDCKNTSLVLSSYHNILKKQSAQNYGRYYYLKDVQRITELVQSGCYDMYCGFAVFLTNDHLYWNPPKKNKNDIAFRLDKDSLAGFPVSGRDYYSFAKIKKPDNTKNSADTKNKNLEFKGSYDIQHWNIPEGKVDENDLSKFYYMITTIRK